MQIDLFHKVAFESSRKVTKAYSNSFSLAIKMLAPSLRDGIYSVYAFVRLADEIVDSFHDHDKKFLLDRFEEDVYLALQNKISLNPVIHSFQITARRYNIGIDLIDAFLESMRKDLVQTTYSKSEYMEYIFGSADVVGLMCLKVFVNGNEKQYEKLKPAAMKLGSAFQKVNFLRDIKNDFELLERSYFPGVDLKNFSANDKDKIVEEIKEDFNRALEGIAMLPSTARFGVYTAYVYYKRLLFKLEQTPHSEIMQRRISVPNYQKLVLIVFSFFSSKIKWA